MNDSTAKESKLTQDFHTMSLLLQEDTHLRKAIVAIVIVNGLSSCLAVVLNFSIIVTFIKTPSLRTPSFILVLSLAISDIGVGALAQPGYCAYLVAMLTNDTRHYQVIKDVYSFPLEILVTSAYLTVFAITVDRYLALRLKLRYQLLVTTKRACLAVASAWFFSALWAFVYFRGIVVVKLILLGSGFVITCISIVLMLAIFRGIRRQSQVQVLHQKAAEQTIITQRYKKSVQTTYYVFALFIVCYIPHQILLTVSSFHYNEPAFHISLVFALTIAMSNSVLNPVIFCWRIQEMRAAVVQLLKMSRCYRLYRARRQ